METILYFSCKRTMRTFYRAPEYQPRAQSLYKYSPRDTYHYQLYGINKHTHIIYFKRDI